MSKYSNNYDNSLFSCGVTSSAVACKIALSLYDDASLLHRYWLWASRQYPIPRRLREVVREAYLHYPKRQIHLRS